VRFFQSSGAVSNYCVVGILSVCCIVYSSVGQAAGIFIRSADTQLQDRVYRLDADIDYRMTSEVVDALHNGVSIVVSIDIEILQQREYWWDRLVATLVQRYRLTYHALAQQYVLENLNTGGKLNYSTWLGALRSMGTLRHFPLMDEHFFKRNAAYTGRIRSGLDIDYLPTPLRLLAYISPEWRLESEWYVWPIHD